MTVISSEVGMCNIIRVSLSSFLSFLVVLVYEDKLINDETPFLNILLLVLPVSVLCISSSPNGTDVQPVLTVSVETGRDR